MPRRSSRRRDYWLLLLLLPPPHFSFFAFGPASAASSSSLRWKGSGGMSRAKGRGGGGEIGAASGSNLPAMHEGARGAEPSKSWCAATLPCKPFQLHFRSHCRIDDPFARRETMRRSGRECGFARVASRKSFLEEHSSRHGIRQIISVRKELFVGLWSVVCTYQWPSFDLLVLPTIPPMANATFHPHLSPE